MRTRFQRKTVVNGILFGIICAAAAGLIIPKFFPRVEFMFIDLRFKARGEIKPRESIVLVAIDDITTREIGKWPFKRLQHENIVKALGYFKAKAVVFDIFFSEPDLETYGESDRILSSAMRDAGNVFLIAREGSKSEEERRKEEEIRKILFDDIYAPAEDVVEKMYPGIFYSYPSDAEVHKEEVERTRWRMLAERFSIPVPKEAEGIFPKVSDLVPPCFPYVISVKGVGFAMVAPDSDGVVRKQHLFVEYRGRLYPQIALFAACSALGADLSSIRIGRGYIEINGSKGYRRIPIDKHGRIVVNWVGPKIDSFKSIPYSVLGISYVDIVDPRRRHKPIVDEEDLRKLIKDSICFVGLIATGTTDLNPTPFSPRYPMVGLHMSIANSIISGSFILESPIWLDLILLFLLSIPVAFLSLGLQAKFGIIVSIAIIASYIGLAFLLFIFWNVWVDVAAPLGAMALSYGSSVSYKFVEEQRTRRRIRSMFERYLPPEVVRSLVSRKDEIKLGGERRRLTVLFSDIRNFTTMSEGMSPEGVVDVLNEYLTAMTEIIFRNGGMVDKFIGDAIMAIFGAPILDPDSRDGHAMRAAKTALEMVRKLEELKKEWEAKGYPTFDIGVGVNTGDMVIGNVGSPRRMDYTVIGDSVNTASRLEGLNKEFGTRIIIGEETYEEIKGIARVRFLGKVQVKGKSEEIGIYELLGLEEKEG